MKKLLIVALCLLGICNARAEMMTAQEIILTEMATMRPWDSKESDDHLEPGRTKNRFSASIEANDLYISTDVDAPVYAEVIDQETGEVIADEEFVGETTMSITDNGDYELYIYTESGSVLTGEFSVN